MSGNSKKKINYSLSEKTLLLRILEKYKTVLENKRTDAVTWREKDAAWNKISEIFNSKSLEGVLRTKESLRKLYENLKKNVRKQIAEENKACIESGPVKRSKTKDFIKEQILSIINAKSSAKRVHGISNDFDVDIKRENLDEETVLQPGTSDNYFPEDLTDSNDHCYDQSECVLDLEILTAPQSILNKSILRDKEKDDEICEKETLEVNRKWSSRSTPIIKEPVEADLTEEYSSLTKLRLELYNEELKLAKNRNQREEELHQLNKEYLKLKMTKIILETKCLEKSLDV